MFNLILALIAVESGGNTFAIGDRGQAHGALQIHRIVIKDVNRIYNTDYRFNDRFNRNKSIKICRLYLAHYATKERLGRDPTFRDMARIWNGGPRGYKKRSTIKYWEKVKLLL